MIRIRALSLASILLTACATNADEDVGQTSAAATCLVCPGTGEGGAGGGFDIDAYLRALLERGMTDAQKDRFSPADDPYEFADAENIHDDEPAPSDVEWRQLPGSVQSYARDRQGRTWSLTTAWGGPGGFNVVRAEPGGAFGPFTGNAIRLDVSPEGVAWAAAADGSVWRNERQLLGPAHDPRGVDESWRPWTGCARDVAAAPHGHLWVLGCMGSNGANQVYHFDPTQGTWTFANGWAKSLTVTTTGRVWVVGGDDQVWMYSGATWKPRGGCARSIGHAGAVPVVVGCEGAVSFRSLDGWRAFPGRAARAGSLATGSPVVVGDDGHPYRLVKKKP